MSELYNNSLDGYGTPMKSKSDEIDEKQAMQDVCCVCLSPLPSLYCLFDDIPEEKELVSTKCNVSSKHVFQMEVDNICFVYSTIFIENVCKK